ncbi:MAG: hypothetical protein A2020_03755 [Lentisphaerae bacterium GWF2_45_14]|nr:MAG: hypothetical protein A2020_03755 [Lentisphaerae bacterium GWF2_45_14]
MKIWKAMTVVGMLPVLSICTGCYTSHKIESTHEIKPIHITLDVNVKIDRALDDFFDDLDKKNVSMPTPALPMPAPVKKVDDPIPGEAAPDTKLPDASKTENTVKSN